MVSVQVRVPSLMNNTITASVDRNKTHAINSANGTDVYTEEVDGVTYTYNKVAVSGSKTKVLPKARKVPPIKN